MTLSTIRSAVAYAKNGAIWKPSHARLFASCLSNRQHNESQGYSDRDHMIAAAEWLERAQDISGDGGVCGRYRLSSGWTSSYPETTGYIIATMLRYGRWSEDRDSIE